MKIKRIFDVLELCCFPKGCLIPDDEQSVLATVLVPDLEAAGMKTAEWTRGALMLEEPHLAEVKSIVCRGCAIHECQFNRQPKSLDDLGDLMHGQYADRIVKADQLIARILPETKRTELTQRGIRCVTNCMPSRKNPHLWFMFIRGEEKREVDCFIGQRILRTNTGEEVLVSLEQVERKIEEAIAAIS